MFRPEPYLHIKEYLCKILTRERREETLGEIL